MNAQSSPIPVERDTRQEQAITPRPRHTVALRGVWGARAIPKAQRFRIAALVAYRLRDATLNETFVYGSQKVWRWAAMSPDAY